MVLNIKKQRVVFSGHFLAFMLVLVGLFGVSIAPTQAATFTVSTAAELIAAIETANGNGEADTITLTADITLTSVNFPDPFLGSSGLPPITSEIVINGNNYVIERDSSAPDFRLFNVSAAAGNLTLNSIVLRGGKATTGLIRGGGLILNFNGTVNVNNSTMGLSSSAELGGSIYNGNGTFTLNGSRLSGSTATRNGGSIYNTVGTFNITNTNISGVTSEEMGGAIYNTGTANITNSRVYGITFVAGGGIYNTGTANITNSTVSGFSTTDGGGIYNTNSLTLNHVTIVSSFALSGTGSGIYNTGTTTMRNSILVGNTGGNQCFLASGTFTTNANNLLGVGGGASSGCPVGGTDIIASGGIATVVNTSSGYNGGLTETYALVAGSPAINVSGAGATTTDQRGVPVQGGTRDIGAFEFGASPTYPTVQFASAGTTYNENAGTVNITLNVTGASNFGGVTEVYVMDVGTGTATSGADYTAFPLTTVTIDCSSGTCPATQTVSLALLTDTVFEPNETVVLRIVGTNGFATIGAQNTFTATIQDATTSTASISATTATATLDPLVNGQFTVDLGMVNATGTPITVNYSVAGTAIAGTDYTALTGSVNVPDGAQTATIDVVPLLTSLVDKTVEVTLTGSSNTNVTVNTTPATVTINAGSASIAFSVNADTVLENGGNQTAQVIYTGAPLQAGQQVDFTVTRADITTSPADFDGTPLVTNASFVAGGATTIDINTAIFDDDIVEANEQYTLTLGGLATIPAGLPVTIGAINVQTVTITDNETPNVHVNPINLNIITGFTSTYAVVLTTGPFADVTVNITPDNADCTTNLTDLTFTSADWDTPQEVTVTAVGVPGSACVINHTATGGAYDAVVIPDVDVTILAPPPPPPAGDAGAGVGGDNPANSPDAWDIQITANTTFIINGEQVIFTITVRKLLGGTPVQVDFPVPAGFTILSATSNRGAVGVNGQLVTYTDDIHVGEVGITTIITQAGANAQAGTSQACIITPVSKCVTLSLAQVSELPATGETPSWALRLRQLLGLE